MNKMKKALLLALSLAMSATLFAACGKDKGGNGGNTSSSSESVSSSESDSSVIGGGESDSSVIDGSESDSSETPSDSSDVGGDSSSDSGVVTPATYAFTKVINPTDFMNGRVTVELEEGAALDLTAPDEVEGKVFKGWVYVDMETGATTPVAEGATMGTEAVVIYADWELTEYKVAITLDGEDYKTLTFAVEGNYEGETPVFGLQELGFNVSAELPQDTKEIKYTVTGLPTQEEGWKLQNYTIEVTSEVVDDDDLAGTIAFWDRLNQNVLNGSKKGEIKNNSANYWDGSTSSVTVENQKAVTSGSDFAMKVSFNFERLTAEEKAEADASWAKWSTTIKQMWVGYAIPVGGIDLTEYDLTFDMKTENMSTSFIVYAASDYDGEGATYAVDNSLTVDRTEGEDLGDGWYRYTVTIDTSWGVGTAADYIVLSLDNTAAEVDKTKDSVAYIDNVSIQKMKYYTVTIDGEASKIKEGTVFTPENPTKEGYEFIGWQDTNGDDVETSFTVMENVTLVPVWKKLPIQAKLGVNSIDISQTCNKEGAFEIVEFSGKAGTYNVAATGVRIFKLADGAMTDEAVSQLVLTEGEKAAFAVTYGEDLEMTGTITLEYVYDPQIDKNSIEFASSVLGSTHSTNPLTKYEGTDDTTAAPNGFNKVTRFDTNTAGVMWVAGYNIADISAYEEVWFAIKIVNGALKTPNGDKATNAWIYFHLTQTAASVWTIEMTIDGEVYETQTNQSGTEIHNDSVQKANTLATILYGNSYSSADGGYVFLNNNGGATMTLYATELLAYVTPWEPEIHKDAVTVVDSALGGTHSTNPLTKYEGTDDTTAAPVGFTKVTRFDTTTANNMWVAAWKNTDISAYSDVWFAIKAVGGTMKTPKGDKVTSSWIYFHLIKTAATTWTIEITIDGVTYETQTNQSGTEVATNVTSVQATNTISTIVYSNAFGTTDGGYVLFYNTSGGTMNIYATEVMGYTKPWSPDIAEKAVKVFDSALGSGHSTDPLTKYEGADDTTAVPVGFDNITRFDADKSGVMWVAGYNTGDLSAYSEVWFAVKVTNGCLKTGKGDKATTSWIYFHLTQTADSVWTIEMTIDGEVYETQTNQSGTEVNNTAVQKANTLATILYGNAYSSADGGYVFLNNTSDATMTLYATEVKGVLKA